MKGCVWGKRFLLGFEQEESGVRFGITFIHFFICISSYAIKVLDLKIKVPRSKHHDLSHAC